MSEGLVEVAYWLDEGWHGWPEIDEIGTAAAGLYARCGAYIADEETDGFIPTARARMYGTPEWIGRLVDVGLWTVEERGFRDTRYFELNASKAEKRRRKDEAAERQRRSRSSRGGHADVTRDKRVSPKAPNPFPPSPNGEGKGGAVLSIGAPCGQCDPHRRIELPNGVLAHCPTCHPRRTA